MNKIKKGTVWEVTGTTCKIKVDDNSLNVSPDITIPVELQATITAGIEVCYIEFEDKTGLVINRTDGA